MQTLNIILLILSTVAYAVIVWMDSKTHTVEHWPIAIIAAAAVVKITVNGEWQNLWTIALPIVLYFLSVKRNDIGGADLKVIAVTGLFYGFISEVLILLIACIVAITVYYVIHRQPKGTKKKTPLCAWIGLSSVLFNSYILISAI